jgi:TRAP-type C4-dicarboxylate transport system substrate-binding protein
MKEKTIRRFLTFALCMIWAFTLSSCGGSASAPADSGASDSETTAESSQNADSAPENRGNFSFIIGAGHGPAGFPYVSCATDVLEPRIIEKAAELGYTVTFTEVMGGTLAPLADVFEATESGLMDFGLVALSLEPVKAQVLAYTNYLPFCIDDVEKSYEIGIKLWNANKDAIDEYFDQFNVKYLGLGGSTSSYQLLTKSEIKTMDDLKGRKIAAAGANLGFLQNTGAVGVQSNLNEAYTSLQTGVYEGWIVFPSGVTANKLNEVAPYYLKTGFGSSNVLAIFVNSDTFDSLPEDLQQTISDAVVEEYGPACVERTINEDAEAYETMEANGVKVAELSKEERDKWIMSIPDPAVEAIADMEAIGLPAQKMFTEYYQFAEELGYATPRKFGIE